MVFTTAGGGATQETGYEISNSFRFDDGASTFLQRTSVANTGEDNATLSFWFKLGNIKTANNGGTIFCEGNTSGDHVIQLYAQKIYIGSENFNLMYPNLIRDPSAWYHLFVAFDSTQGTAANRVKPYLNGVLLENPTTFTTYPDQNENLNITKNGTTTRIGGRGNSGDESFDGYLAEFHYLDGTTKAYTDFGEFDDNGVWIPKKYTGGSYGNNGFFLEFKQTGGAADATGLGADTSGEGHHFSGDNVVGATDVTTDTPTNNFATLNSLSNFEGSTLSEGNTKAVTPSSSTTPANKNGLVPATMGVQNGKWYWEVNVPTTNFVAVGIIADDKLDKDYLTAASSSTRIVKGDDGKKYSSNSDGGSYMAAYEGSILQVALNLDDGEITFGAGGNWANGSGATNQTFANSTPAYTDLNSSSDFTNKFILPVVSDENQGTSDTFEMNFGNPPFAISSGNSDANGYGNFEYAVPSGYYALCTKNLARYG